MLDWNIQRCTRDFEIGKSLAAIVGETSCRAIFCLKILSGDRWKVKLVRLKSLMMSYFWSDGVTITNEKIFLCSIYFVSLSNCCSMNSTTIVHLEYAVAVLIKSLSEQPTLKQRCLNHTRKHLTIQRRTN